MTGHGSNTRTTRTTHTLLTDAQGGLVRRTVLPGGLRIVTEAVPNVRSVSFGIWVGVGSRDEPSHLAGATHYLEHLLFKGTPKRTALEISASLEGVGGDINAFTSKEYTCYYARVLDTDLPLAVDVVCDLVSSALVTDADVEAERDVVLEEISMTEDDPSDCVHELSTQKFWPDSALALPTLGTVEGIKSLSGEAIRGWYKSRYGAPNLVVAAAGNVDHDVVVGLVEQALADTDMLSDRDAVPAEKRIGGLVPVAASGVHLLSRPTEQANVVLAVPGFSRTDDRRYAVGVLNAALGSGMSSRLFQEVRERRGLAYSVYSYASSFAETGSLGVYVGCQPQKVDQVLEVTRQVLAEVAKDAITEAELQRGKGQLRGSLVLGLEATGSRMSRIGKSELVYPDLPAIGEVLDRIDAVTMDQVADVASAWNAPELVAVVGPFDEAHQFAAST